MQTIDNYNFKNKKALIRVDFNVPLNEKFEITDDTRMRAAVPTIKKVLAGGGSVILMSHLGRPKNGPEDKFSLKHIQKHLEELLGTPVQFADDCIGESAVKAAADLKPGEVLLLENLRFYKEEEKGDENFAHKLASLADVWIVRDSPPGSRVHRCHCQIFPERQAIRLRHARRAGKRGQSNAQPHPPVHGHHGRFQSLIQNRHHHEPHGQGGQPHPRRRNDLHVQKSNGWSCRQFHLRRRQTRLGS